MTPVAADLVTALTAAFPTYVEQRMQELGLARPERLANAIQEGKAWLCCTLQELLSRPFAEQGRGPLEVFQEAMSFPTDALVASGVEAVSRDAGAVAAIPGDIYDLAPASSRSLGDEVWMAHLAWGAAKAQALGRVGLVSANLMDRAKIEPLVTGSGRMLVVSDGAGARAGFPAGEIPDLVLVDLAWPDSIAVVERSVRAGARVVAFGPHVDREALRSALEVGAVEALPRSAFFAKLSELFG